MVLQVHTLTALSLSLTLPLSSCLIFIIKILFLISMDFVPRAVMALTPLTLTYNVLNIQIKIFSLSSFLQHVKLFLQSTTKPTPPTPSLFPFPPRLWPGLHKHNFLSRCSQCDPPPTQRLCTAPTHSPPPALVSLQLESKRLQ